VKQFVLYYLWLVAAWVVLVWATVEPVKWSRVFFFHRDFFFFTSEAWLHRVLQ
jgi:hypothetical protein